MLKTEQNLINVSDEMPTAEVGLCVRPAED